MASTETKFTYSDFFDPNLVKEIERVQSAFKNLKSEAQRIKKITPTRVSSTADYTKANKAQQEMAKLSAKLEQLKTREAAATQKLKLQISEKVRETKAEIKASQAKEGSMTKLSLELGKMKKQYRELSKEERENVNIGGKLLKQIQLKDKEIKELDGSIGNHQRNVGNYSGSIREAANDMGLFSGKLGSMANAFGGLKNGLRTAKMGFVSLRTAMMSSGIGAIVVALGSLVTYLTKTTKGSRLLSRIMKGVGAAFDVVVDKLATFGESLINAVSKPRELFDKFKNYITTKIVPVFSGLGRIIKGIFKFDWDEVKAGAGEVRESFTAVVDDIKTGVKSISVDVADLAGEMWEAGKAAAELEGRTQKLTDAERQFRIEKAKMQKKIQELIYLSRDETATYEKRMEALKEANTIEEQQLQRAEQLAREKLSILRAEADLNRKNNRLQEEDLERIAEAEIELSNIQAQNLARRRELLNRQNELSNKWANDERKKAKEHADFLKQLEKDEIEFEKELVKSLDETLNESDERVTEMVINNAIKRREAYEQMQADQKEFVEKQIEEVNRIIDISSQAFGAVKNIFDQQEQSKLQSLQSRLDQGLISEEQFEKEKMAIQKKYAKKRQQIELSQAYISGAKVILNALQTQPWWMALAQSIIAGSMVAQQISTIKSQKFAEGEIDIPGPKHSQGGIPAEIEGGESVINAGATAKSKRSLELINEGVLSDNEILGAIQAPIENKMTLGAVLMPDRQDMPQLLEKTSVLIREAQRTNDLLSRWKFLTDDGKTITDLMGNITRYV